MPTLASSLLGLGSLIENLAELGGVKKHLFRASREILLAIQALLGFADERVSGLGPLADHQQTLRSAISFAQKTLRKIAHQLPRGDEEEYRAVHRKVMGSILEVLEGEIRKHSKASSQKAKMKVEVLQAIRGVLLKEMYEHETKDPS